MSERTAITIRRVDPDPGMLGYVAPGVVGMVTGFSPFHPDRDADFFVNRSEPMWLFTCDPGRRRAAKP